MKQMYTPVNPNLLYKMGCKGVFVTRTCFRDGILEHIVVSNIWITNLKTERLAFEVTAVKLFNLISSVGRIKKKQNETEFHGHHS